jgi:hypothetical protein
MECVESPSVAKPKLDHGFRDELGSPTGAVVDISRPHEHAGSAGVRLYVVSLATKALEAEEVVKGLPYDAGDWLGSHQAEHDNLGPGRNAHDITSAD